MKKTDQDLEIISFIKQDNGAFEQMFVITCAWDEPLFRQVRRHLVQQNEYSAEGKFQSTANEGLYQVLANINGRILDTGGSMSGTTLPSFELVQAEIRSLVTRGIVLEMEASSIMRVYQEACPKYCNQQSAQIARGGWKHWLTFQNRRVICRNALLRPDGDVAKQLAEAARAVNVSGDDEQILSLQQIASRQGKQAVRIATGFTPLDRKLGGGFAKGEGALILGATGCGKSICSTQFSVNMSSLMTGCKGLLIATEMEPEDFHRRIISNKLRINYAQLKDGIPKAMLQEEEFRQQHDALTQNLEKAWRIFRWRDHCGLGIFSTIDDLIKRTQDEMGGLDHVHLDWLGGALGKEAYGTGREPRLVWQEAADSCAKLAAAHDIAVIAYAQAHPQNALGKKRVGAEMASECKSLHREMTTAIGISAILDDSCGIDDRNGFEEKTYKDIQNFFISKSRKSEGGSVPFRRNFHQMRIDPM